MVMYCKHTAYQSLCWFLSFFPSHYVCPTFPKGLLDIYWGLFELQQWGQTVCLIGTSIASASLQAFFFSFLFFFFYFIPWLFIPNRDVSKNPPQLIDLLVNSYSNVTQSAHLWRGISRAVENEVELLALCCFYCTALQFVSYTVFTCIYYYRSLSLYCLLNLLLSFMHFTGLSRDRHCKT